MALINLSILIALMLRLFYYLAYEAPKIDPATVDYNRTIWLYIYSYLNATWLLTLICIIVFSLSGFYTYGRFYKGRYKILIVVQAVSISYLILGLMAYFFRERHLLPAARRVRPLLAAVAGFPGRSPGLVIPAPEYLLP